MKAIVINEFGGPEILKLTEVPMPVAQVDQIIVRNKAIGVNFVDTQHRAGQPYPVGLPLIPGIEAAGLVQAVGPDVTEFNVGDRVAFAGHMGGVYAEYSVVPEGRLIPLPNQVDFTMAAAALLQGMTAHGLTHSAYAINPGDVVLVHAAGSGVGLYLVQMAKQRGATVIGTVSTPQKAHLAQYCGADHTILYTEDDFEVAVKRLTKDQGVHVIYDSVGKDTFDRNLNILQAKGRLVLFGLTSGSIPPFDINRLSGITGSGNRGSLYLTWATLSDYTASRQDLVWRARDVLTWVAEGTLSVNIAQMLPLSEAAEAHRLLASRRVAGKLILVPDQEL